MLYDVVQHILDLKDDGKPAVSSSGDP